MSIRKMKHPVEDKIQVKNVLVSTFDKSGLEDLVPEIINLSPEVKFYSTGGTYRRLNEIMGGKSLDHLESISEYTGCPEMEGGLVKTLTHKIHAGLLGERNNPLHQQYLQEDCDGGVYFDLVVVNLYPFEEIVKKVDNDFEQARGFIDIGGPTMLRAAAKNFMSCAVLCDPKLYGDFLLELRENKGHTTFEQRFGLMTEVFDLTTSYEEDIADYLESFNAKDIKEQYFGVQEE